MIYVVRAGVSDDVTFKAFWTFMDKCACMCISMLLVGHRGYCCILCCNSILVLIYAQGVFPSSIDS